MINDMKKLFEIAGVSHLNKAKQLMELRNVSVSFDHSVRLQHFMLDTLKTHGYQLSNPPGHPFKEGGVYRIEGITHPGKNADEIRKELTNFVQTVKSKSNLSDDDIEVDVTTDVNTGAGKASVVFRWNLSREDHAEIQHDKDRQAASKLFY